MRVFITGGTGLIGGNLARRLTARGDQVVVLSRRARSIGNDPLFRGLELVEGDPMLAGDWGRAVDGCDAVVNLAGENLFGKRWDADVRRMLRDSRTFSTGNVVGAIAAAKNPPKTLVQASAIGYYGTRGDEELDEAAKPGTDFMAEVCQAWENAASPVQEIGTRLAIVRIGVVLARGAGALGVMTPIFKWLPGGAAPVGGNGSLAPAFGKVWFSWIHIDDIVGILMLALDHPEARGPINGTAPNPVRNVDFGRALAKVLWRPFLPIGPPNAALKLILGDVAEVITNSLRVLPKRASALGYRFEYADVKSALEAIFAKPKNAQKKTPVAAEV